MDASLIKFVCSTGASHFEKGIGWHERVDKLFGTGIFNAEGEIWKTGRATARPFFAKERISDFDIFEQNSVSALDLMASRAHAHLPLDIQDLAARFTLDVAAQFLCGMKLDTLSQPLLVPGKVKLGPRGGVPVDGLTEFDEFSGAIERVAVQMSRRGTQGNTWPLFELLGDKTEESIGTIMNWLEPVVERAVVEKAKRRAAGLETHASENVFIDFLASKTDNVEHIRYELVTYLIASRDATASLVTFVVYFLAMYPATCERLRNDVLEVLGADEPPTYGTLKKMKYLQAVLNETLRLFPSTPRISRSSLGTPLVIPTSEHPALYFPPRTQVMMFSLLLHRRRDLWGADADEFRPERWLEAETTTKLSTTPFMYCPFSGGPRVCTGQEFGLNEAGFFVVKLLQRFKGFTLAPEFQPAGSLPSKDWQGRPGRQGIEKVFPASSFTLHSKGGLWLYGNLAE
ncbi:cytochrome P450 [Mycena filopes]|nr:cytochrome P450 [Mycena filopes]